MSHDQNRIKKSTVSIGERKIYNGCKITELMLWELLEQHYTTTLYNNIIQQHYTKTYNMIVLLMHC